MSALLGVGPLSTHMIEHMALLGVAAPVSAYALQSVPIAWNGARLALAAIAQIALLWIWHLPPIFSLASESGLLHAMMAGSLYVAGVLFWSAVFGTAPASRWQSVVALLMTGKLFCLFAAILVFSPRRLYDMGAHAHHGVAGIGLEDQQIAGLIMITVCPLTYVAAGIAMAARWLLSMDEDDRAAARLSAASKLRSAAPCVIVPLTALLGGCEGVQSLLAPASPQAKSAFDLTLVLMIGGTIIFAIVMVALALALFATGAWRTGVGDARIVTYGGIVFPIAVLTPLLGYGLWLKRDEARASAVKEISVHGERWWWRVTYGDADGRMVSGANEIRLEAGQPVRLKLTSNDVIHSFWVPALAGKVDMIPGRINELIFTPTRTGVYRGQCAEYCGGAHAHMSLRVIVLDPEAYASWRAETARPAAAPNDPLLMRGQEVFRATCVTCHSVRGTIAGGRLGPDLTHLASRSAIGAETLPMSQENLARWLTENQKLKPGNLMPEYAGMPAQDVQALTAYLASLK